MTETVGQGQRLVSLDALRGFTVAGMIVVNSPANWNHVYSPLLHAEWHGLTPTDLVFPFFVFVMGVSVVLGLSRSTGQVTRDQLVVKVLRRSGIIFSLGLLLALINMLAKGSFALESFRIPGVLQRLAIIYCCCALLFVYTSWKTQLGIMVGTLVGYWCLMIWVPVPGVGAGVLEPGKNLANWLDGQLIPGRLYQGSWDPEGLLSTLPAIGSGLLGMMAGHLLCVLHGNRQKLAWLIAGGTVAVVLGLAWQLVFPFNKNLWSSSFALYTAGLAALALALALWLVDVCGIHRWTWVGIVFGANAITAYVLHGLLQWPFRLIYVGQGDSAISLRSCAFESLQSAGLSAEGASLFWALAYTGLCFLPVWWLYRRRIFIKV